MKEDKTELQILILGKVDEPIEVISAMAISVRKFLQQYYPEQFEQASAELSDEMKYKVQQKLQPLKLHAGALMLLGSEIIEFAADFVKEGITEETLDPEKAAKKFAEAITKSIRKHKKGDQTNG